VRLAAIVMTVIMIPLFLTSGAADETRALALVFPFVFVVMVEGAHALFEPPRRAGAVVRELPVAEEPSRVRAREFARLIRERLS
jgi:hypothetical protein